MPRYTGMFEMNIADFLARLGIKSVIGFEPMMGLSDQSLKPPSKTGAGKNTTKLEKPCRHQKFENVYSWSQNALNES